MIKLKKLFEELDGKGKISMATAIYKQIFSNCKRCKDPDGSYQCHDSVLFVKNDNELKLNWWYKDIKFHEWNELKWKKVGDKLKKDNKKFASKHINNLIEDIGDGTVNGHSFMSFQGYYVDPYLKSFKVNEKEIQKFDAYFKGIM